MCCGPIPAKTKSTSLYAAVACARNLLIGADYGNRQVFAGLIDLLDLLPVEVGADVQQALLDNSLLPQMFHDL